MDLVGLGVGLGLGVGGRGGCEFFFFFFLIGCFGFLGFFYVAWRERGRD